MDSTTNLIKWFDTLQVILLKYSKFACKMEYYNLHYWNQILEFFLFKYAANVIEILEVRRRESSSIFQMDKLDIINIINCTNKF